MTVFLQNLDLSKIGNNGRLHKRSNSKTGSALPFPAKLYKMLEEVEDRGLDHIVSWHPNGKTFHVHSSPKFVKEVLPLYFRCSKYKSFQRQLNFYNFERIVTGPLEGSYSHPQFIRGQPELCRGIKRQQEPKQPPAVVETSSVDSQANQAAEEQSLPESKNVHQTNLEPHITETTEQDSLYNILRNTFEEVQAQCVKPDPPTRRVSNEAGQSQMENTFQQSNEDVLVIDKNFFDLTQSNDAPEVEQSVPPVTQEAQCIPDYTEDDFTPNDVLDGTRMSFVGKNFFFLPVDFTDL